MINRKLRGDQPPRDPPRRGGPRWLALERRLPRYDGEADRRVAKTGCIGFIAMVCFAPLLSVLGGSFRPSWVPGWSTELLPQALGIAFIVFVVTVVFIYVRRHLTTSDITIGTDGVVIERPRYRRYIPYGQLLAANVNGASVVFELADGAVWELPLAEVAKARALADDLQRAMAIHGSRAADIRLEELERRGRPLREWRAALAQLPKAEADFRQRVVSQDDLLSVAIDPSARPERRVAAAVALAQAEESRVRVAVDSAALECANEPLRVALMKAADGELDEGAIAEAEAQYGAEAEE